MRRQAVLIEKSESSTTNISLYWDYWLKERITTKDHPLIIWIENPGFEIARTSKLDSLYASIYTNEIDNNFISLASLLSSKTRKPVEILPLDLLTIKKNIMKDYIKAISSFSQHLGGIDLVDAISKLQHREIPIGLSILQWLHNIDPYIHLVGLKNSRELHLYIYSQIAYINLVEFMISKFDIKAFLATEHVYLCSSILTFIQRHNICTPRPNDVLRKGKMLSSLPNLQEYRSPFLSIYDERYKSMDSHMPGIRQKIKEVNKILTEPRVKGINESESMENSKIICNTLKSKVTGQIEDIKNIDELRNLPHYSNSIIIFLQAFSDASLQEGYNGFNGAVDFFLSILEGIAKNRFLNGSAIYIKPHPNMMLKKVDPTPNQLRLLEKDFILSAHIINCAIKLAMANNCAIYLLNPGISNTSLANLSNPLCITHIGTCALEMAYVGVPSIYNSLAPYSPSLQLGLSINSKEQLDNQLCSFNLSAGVTLSSKDKIAKYYWINFFSEDIMAEKLLMKEINQITSDIGLTKLVSERSNNISFEELYGDKFDRLKSLIHCHFQMSERP